MGILWFGFWQPFSTSSLGIIQCYYELGGFRLIIWWDAIRTEWCLRCWIHLFLTLGIKLQLNHLYLCILPLITQIATMLLFCYKVKTTLKAESIECLSRRASVGRWCFIAWNYSKIHKQWHNCAFQDLPFLNRIII